MHCRPTLVRRIVWTAMASLVLFGSAAAQQTTDPAEIAALIEELNLTAAEQPASARSDWHKPTKVVVRYADAERIAWLQEVAPGVTLVPVATSAEAVAEAGGAQAVIGVCNEELLEAAEELVWIQLMSAGAEYCVNVDAVGTRDLLVTNMQHAASAPIAEHVIAMMMALTRQLDRFITQQANAHWDRELVPRGEMWEVRGKTLLVVGLGGIGTEVAWRANALGMDVLATRNSRREGPEFVSYVGLADELLELAAKADVVVNATPLTPATTGLFDAEFFAAMPEHSYFINVGRGRSVVTDDLVAALQSGEIGGAGLDVTEPEPLPDNHPLWRLPNVIITPHTASASDQGREKQWLIVRENLRRYVAGEPMLSVVDVERGY